MISNTYAPAVRYMYMHTHTPTDTYIPMYEPIYTHTHIYSHWQVYSQKSKMEYEQGSDVLEILFMSKSIHRMQISWEKHTANPGQDCDQYNNAPTASNKWTNWNCGNLDKLWNYSTWSTLPVIADGGYCPAETSQPPTQCVFGNYIGPTLQIFNH